MRKSKYIIIDDGRILSPFLFPEWETHSDIARVLKRHGGDVVSAGFVAFGVDADNRVSVAAYGNSESLKVKARDGDSRLIAKALGIAEEDSPW